MQHKLIGNPEGKPIVRRLEKSTEEEGETSNKYMHLTAEEMTVRSTEKMGNSERSLVFPRLVREVRPGMCVFGFDDLVLGLRYVLLKSPDLRLT